MDDRIVARERPEHGLNWGKSGIYGRGGEGRGGRTFSCACNTLVPSRPRSFLFSPFLQPRDLASSFDPDGVEREREKEKREKESNPPIAQFENDYSTMIIHKNRRKKCIR